MALLDAFSLGMSTSSTLKLLTIKATGSVTQYTKILKRSQSTKNSKKYGQYYVYRNPGAKTPNPLVKKQLRQKPKTAECYKRSLSTTKHNEHAIL